MDGMSRTPEQVVRDFCAAWSRLDIDELMTYFADDAVYHNMPTEPLKGRDVIRAGIQQFTANWERTEWEIVEMASNGNVVFAERVDRIDAGGRHLDLPVTGVFVLEGEQIKDWRDYFDIGTYMRALVE